MTPDRHKFKYAPWTDTVPGCEPLLSPPFANAAFQTAACGGCLSGHGHQLDHPVAHPGEPQALALSWSVAPRQVLHRHKLAVCALHARIGDVL